MIVKNEEKVIERMLLSVISIIDTFVICDTGSTDNTEEIILRIMREHGKTGKIVHEAFQNFEYNRNIALFAAREMGDFILLMDADMCLVIGEKWNKCDLNNWDVISLIQDSPILLYDNVRIVRNISDMQYRCYTHEYLETPSTSRRITFTCEQCFIRDVGDGGSKSNKVERDIQLLKQGIEEEPENPRNYFYLANTYFDSGKFEESMPYYEKRIELGQWFEEMFFSLYRMGVAWKYLKQPEKAHLFFLKAYEIHPLRIESLYELVNYFRLQGNNQTALLYYHAAVNTLKKTTLQQRGTFLFLFKPVYDYLLFYEYTILSFYQTIPAIVGTPPLPWKEIVQVLNHTSDVNILQSILKNIKFYNTQIPASRVIWELTDPIILDGITFYPSTPCIISPIDFATQENPYYLMNIRYVNYKINKNTRGYTDYYQNKYIITMNKYIRIDLRDSTCRALGTDFKPGEILHRISKFPELCYVGMEDHKLKLTPTELLVMGTIQDPITKQLRIGYGCWELTYPQNQKEYNLLELPPELPNKPTEKNWVFLTKDIIVYTWYPLVLLRLPSLEHHSKKCQLIKTMPVPKFFQYLRGSSSSFFYKNEYYFICHMVSEEPQRYYYHLFVVLNEKYELTRFSRIFTFNSQPVEFALGLIIENNRVLCSFSEWDNGSNIMEIPKNEFDALFHDIKI
jgi:tetratricopeptide (TPR) repeat protein